MAAAVTTTPTTAPSPVDGLTPELLRARRRSLADDNLILMMIVSGPATGAPFRKSNRARERPRSAAGYVGRWACAGGWRAIDLQLRPTRRAGERARDSS